MDSFDPAGVHAVVKVGRRCGWARACAGMRKTRRCTSADLRPSRRRSPAIAYMPAKRTAALSEPSLGRRVRRTDRSTVGVLAVLGGFRRGRVCDRRRSGRQTRRFEPPPPAQSSSRQWCPELSTGLRRRRRWYGARDRQARRSKISHMLVPPRRPMTATAISSSTVHAAHRTVVPVRPLAVFDRRRGSTTASRPCEADEGRSPRAEAAPSASLAPGDQPVASSTTTLAEHPPSPAATAVDATNGRAQPRRCITRIPAGRVALLHPLQQGK